MEIKTAFTIIIGIMMMATVVLAVIATMSGLTMVMVEDCEPAGYQASPDYKGTECGFNQDGEQLRCNMIRLGTNSAKDDCVDEDINLCCPTETGKTNLYSYTASEDYRGEVCGEASGTVLRCETGSECVNKATNICRPRIRIIGKKCCKVVEVGG